MRKPSPFISSSTLAASATQARTTRGSLPEQSAQPFHPVHQTGSQEEGVRG